MDKCVKAQTGVAKIPDDAWCQWDVLFFFFFFYSTKQATLYSAHSKPTWVLENWPWISYLWLGYIFAEILRDSYNS